MAFPPGQGLHGEELKRLWREYLEQYAEREGDLEGQIVVGAFHATEVFGELSLTLDRSAGLRTLIEQRVAFFSEAVLRARDFEDRLAAAGFGLYHHLDTVARHFAGDNTEAGALIRAVNAGLMEQVYDLDQAERAGAALRAAFPLLALATLALDQGGGMTATIRQVEARFSEGARLEGPWNQIVHACYRLVEMMQIFALLGDGTLAEEVNQIAARFQEEDQDRGTEPKLRNGFCRLFELGHLVATHLDERLGR